MKRIGHEEALSFAEMLRIRFVSKIQDGEYIQLGDVKNLMEQHGCGSMGATNFLLTVIFRLSDQIADLRQTLKSMQPREIDEPKKCMESAKPSCDIVSHPCHYNAHAKECIVEMYILFGLDKFIAFCQMNAWKYRYRAGNKANNSADQDNAKADRYIEYARRAREVDYWTLDPKRLTDDEFWSKQEA